MFALYYMKYDQVLNLNYVVKEIMRSILTTFLTIWKPTINQEGDHKEFVAPYLYMKRTLRQNWMSMSQICV